MFRGKHLQIHLCAAEHRQALLDISHQCGANASSLVRDINGNRIQPATVAIISRQGCSGHAVFIKGDKQEIGLSCDLCWDYNLGTIPRRIAWKRRLPQRFHPCKILIAVGLDCNAQIGTRSTSSSVTSSWRRS